MDIDPPEPRKERRQGPDFWLTAIEMAGIFSVCAFLAAIFFFDRSRPPMETFFDRWLSVQLRPGWDKSLLQYMFYCTAGAFYFSGMGLIINTRRHKRSTDRYRPTLILLGILSMLGLLSYIIFT